MKTVCGFHVIVLLFLWLSVQAEAQDTDTGTTPPPVKNTLTAGDQKYLLTLARNTLIHYLSGKPIQALDKKKLSPALIEKRGCFVTLEKNGNLRGCIGYIQPVKSLCECVMENAVNAATQDPRFPEVNFDELNVITIEISALTVPEPLEVKNRKTLLQVLVPGRDGVILSNGWKNSTFLPQVWEHFADAESFLNALCEKGGMPGGCWEDEHTAIFTYHAEVFKEKNH
ncbi:MAG TPA: AmmeMemoRadiSam system protein A [Thermodesulfobacteriota bacterium]|nr:AmmeMemoRadiSam system protein A [Thermodesulfobacteriota bacterium]